MKEINRNLLFFSFISLFLSIFLAKGVQAHCPLCTAGAALAAGGALWLGVNVIVIGLFIGAFALSLGFWTSKLVKKKFIPYQATAMILLVFLLTVVPIMPIMTNVLPINVWITGDYGSWLNRTYLINSFFVGSLIGGALVSLSPSLSRNISKIRGGRNIPFQGVLITLLLLVVAGALIQVIAT